MYANGRVGATVILASLSLQYVTLNSAVPSLQPLPEHMHVTITTRTQSHPDSRQTRVGRTKP
jgi:hypothetical protein